MTTRTTEDFAQPCHCAGALVEGHWQRSALRASLRVMRRFLALALIALALGGCTPSPAPSSTAEARTEPGLHQRMLTLDSHIDTPVHFDRPGYDFARRQSFAEDLTHVDLRRMEGGNLDGGFFVIYTPQGTDQAAMARAAEARLASTLRTIASHSGDIVLARASSDILSIEHAGKRFAMLSVENSGPLGADPATWQRWYGAGVRMAGPVHSRTNQLADSTTGERRWGGLSPEGRAWVALMNRLGIVVDASHASDEATRQMAELSTTPIILSHSGFRAIYDHPRNISDDFARELAAKGAVIAINSVFLSRFNNSDARKPLYEEFDHLPQMPVEAQRDLARRWHDLDQRERVNEGDIALYVRAVDHCLRLVGPAHCGIGADWDGGGGVRGMEDIAALPDVTARLQALGWSPRDLAALWAGNTLRLLRIAEQRRERPALR